MLENIVLIACGSFNPPTPMHFRMFEIARDHFRVTNTGNVIGGIVSPVHDSYKKPNVHLTSAKHRYKMIQMALLSSDWIRVSDWEIKQNHWTPTSDVLRFHQNELNAILQDNRNYLKNHPNWIPSNINDVRGQEVRVKLLCGADLLESFTSKNLWQSTQLETILNEHGVVVVARSGSNQRKFIFDSDLLFKSQNNIMIIENWVPNEISSTLVRVHLRRGLSVKYLLHDNIIEYIYQHKLYGCDTKQQNVQKQIPFKVNPHKIIINDTNLDGSETLDMDVTDSPLSNPRTPCHNDQTMFAQKQMYWLRDRTINRRSCKRRRNIKAVI